MRIKAFTLRIKTSKQGKQYWVAPYGNVDLLAFQDSEGNIEVSYCEREARPATGYPAKPQAQATRAPKITPRPQPQTAERPRIIPRDQQQRQDYVDHTRQSPGSKYDQLEPAPSLYESGDPGFNADEIPF